MLDGEYTSAVVATDVSHTETSCISDAPIAAVPAAIVAGNTATVGTVAGETVTSNAIMDAVVKGLEQAVQ